jgi:hypothetical protein
MPDWCRNSKVQLDTTSIFTVLFCSGLTRKAPILKELASDNSVTFHFIQGPHKQDHLLDSRSTLAESHTFGS